MWLRRQPRINQLGRPGRCGRSAGRAVSWPEFQPLIEGPGPGQMMRHGGAEAAGRAFLDGDEHLVVARELVDEAPSSGLMKRASATVEGKPCAASSAAAFSASARRGPECQNGHLAALPQDAALPISSRRPRAGSSMPAPRRADSGRPGPVVDRRSGGDRMHQFRLVGGRHDDHVRQAGRESRGRRNRHECAIRPHQTGAVHGEAHRQVLQPTSCTTWS